MDVSLHSAACEVGTPPPPAPAAAPRARSGPAASAAAPLPRALRAGTRAAGPGLPRSARLPRGTPRRGAGPPPIRPLAPRNAAPRGRARPGESSAGSAPGYSGNAGRIGAAPRIQATSFPGRPPPEPPRRSGAPPCDASAARRGRAGGAPPPGGRTAPARAGELAAPVFPPAALGSHLVHGAAGRPRYKLRFPARPAPARASRSAAARGGGRIATFCEKAEIGRARAAASPVLARGAAGGRCAGLTRS